MIVLQRIAGHKTYILPVGRNAESTGSTSNHLIADAIQPCNRPQNTAARPASPSDSCISKQMGDLKTLPSLYLWIMRTWRVGGASSGPVGARAGAEYHHSCQIPLMLHEFTPIGSRSSAIPGHSFNFTDMSAWPRALYIWPSYLQDRLDYHKTQVQKDHQCNNTPSALLTDECSSTMFCPS